MSDLKDEIKAQLREFVGLQLGQIVKRLPGFKPDTISVALSKMRAAGEVDRDQYGWYLIEAGTWRKPKLLETEAELVAVNCVQPFQYRIGDCVPPDVWERAQGGPRYELAASTAAAKEVGPHEDAIEAKEPPQEEQAPRGNRMLTAAEFLSPGAEIERDEAQDLACEAAADPDTFHAEQAEDDEQCAYVFHVEHDGDYIRIAGNSRAVLRAIGAVTKELLDESL